MNKLKEKLINALGSTLGLIIGVLMFLIPVILIGLCIRFGVALLEWFTFISIICIFIQIIILLPLYFFKKTRHITAIGLLIFSYVYGICLWFQSLLLTYYLWGAWAVVSGLFMFGVGVFPIAILATLFSGMWATLIELAILALLTYGSRFLSIYVEKKYYEDEYAIY